MDPGELASDAEPGLVEVRDRRRNQCRADGLHCAAQRAGDPADHAGDRALGDRNAEQLAHRLAGPGAGQELAVPQVRARRADARTVLHGRVHPGRRRAGRDRAARAAAGHDLVLGDLRPDLLEQVGDLAALGTGDRRAGQPLPAPGARHRLVRDHYVRVSGHLHGRGRRDIGHEP